MDAECGCSECIGMEVVDRFALRAAVGSGQAGVGREGGTGAGPAMDARVVGQRAVGIVDGASSLCLGCYRTLSEIGGWSGLTDEERAAPPYESDELRQWRAHAAACVGVLAVLGAGFAAADHIIITARHI